MEGASTKSIWDPTIPSDSLVIRRLLEGAAAARAAELATPEQIAQLRDLAVIPSPVPADAGRATNYRDAEAANARFHLAVAAAARNTLAADRIERCLAQVDRFMSLGLPFGPFQDGASAAHLEIVEAIAERDANAARARMEAHLDCGSERMKELLLRGVATIGVD